jgi:hypothetical protein
MGGWVMLGFMDYCNGYSKKGTSIHAFFSGASSSLFKGKLIKIAINNVA